jgi:hypothetical protein
MELVKLFLHDPIVSRVSSSVSLLSAIPSRGDRTPGRPAQIVMMVF